MEMNFCRRCGKPLTKAAKHMYKCADGHTIFPNSSPTVGVFFVTPDNHVLLSVRGIEPHKGMLDAVGGFLDGEESLEDAARREIREEVQLEPDQYEPFRYLTSCYETYPYQGESLPIASAMYWTRLKGDAQLQPSDDVLEIKSVPLHEVDMAALHADDIRAGIRELQRLFQSNESKEKR